MIAQKIIDNPQAFPFEPSGKTMVFNQGMTLRDYFAGQVIQGCITAIPETLAETAYEIADAMLKEREK